MKKLAFAAAAAIALCIAPAFHAAAEEAAADKAETPVSVTLKGDNVCLISAYGSEEDKTAAKEAGGCFALKVTEATDADGKAVEGVAGHIVHYLPTEASKALNGEGAAGKPVTVTGKYYPSASLVVVEKVEGLEGGDDEWEELPSTSLSGKPVF